MSTLAWLAMALVVAGVTIGCAVATCLWVLVCLLPPRRRPPAPPAPQDSCAVRFGILIPAHNEALGLPRTLAQIARLDYPRDHVACWVVADHCDDETASIARAAGASVLERQHEPQRGKGYALAAGLEFLRPHVDAILILDADCDLAPTALRDFAAHIAAGAEAIQAAVRPRDPEAAPSPLVAAAGAALENALTTGLDRLGFSVMLRGTGMVFTAGLLARQPWRAFGLTEDREYAEALHRAGIRIRWAPEIDVANDAAPSLAALGVQRRRWKVGLWRGGPRRWLESKPLLLAGYTGLMLVTLALAPVWFAHPMVAYIVPVWGLMLLQLAHVAVKVIRRARVPFEFWSALKVTAHLTAWLLPVGTQVRDWQRTPRRIESPATPTTNL